jgi:transcriptional regulator GlxA family with amidase domain
MRRVVLVAFPEVEVLDLAGPLQVFHEARRAGAHYEILTCGLEPRVRTDQGLVLAELTPLPSPQPGDLVVVPGLQFAALRRTSQPLSGWLAGAARAGAHIGSVCTGAFLLGAAGLLDQRQCTTHWSRVDDLQEAYPSARVLRDCLFVTDGGITTSAGIASGIDMALAHVEQDHGPRLAAAVAREMVVFLRRNGAHGQQSVYLDYRGHLHPGIHRVQDWLSEHADEPATLTALARIAAMSPRHLTRMFRQATGISIRDYLTRLRLERAKVLIHDPKLTLDTVAVRSGFSGARQLRRCWREVYGSLPSQDRRPPEASSPSMETER